MRKSAEQCHSLLHASTNGIGSFAHLHGRDLVTLSGAFADIMRIDYSVQLSRLAITLDPYSINWKRQEFENLFPNRMHLPCMFTNHWNRNWQLKSYFDDLRDENEVNVKIAHGNEGMNMTWNDFMRYLACDCLAHDHPLYVVDDDFHLKLPEFNMAYCVPAPFAWTLDEDVFSYHSDANRPPYRWLVVGGWRSGSPLHTDPYHSSAWNVNVKGKKRWLVFPQQGDEDDRMQYNYDDNMPPMQWFVQEYEKMVKQNGGSRYWFEFIQNEGDMVYIPKGWVHTVLNLEETIAVTHNFTLKEDREMVMERWKQQIDFQ